MKRIINILLVSLLLLGLCACGEKEVTVTKKDDALDHEYSTSIYVVSSWGNFEALEAAAQVFNKEYPYIQVVYEQLGDFGGDLANRFISKENIDIYAWDWVLTSDDRYEKYWANALDLSDKLNFECIDSLYLESGYVADKQAFVPIYTYSYGYMVNEDLLAKYNLSVPDTYEEFINACDVLKNEGVYPVLMADQDFLNQSFISHLYNQLSADKDTDKATQDILNGNDSNGYLKDTVDRMNDFYSREYIHPDSYELSDNYNAAIMRFFEGDIAFVPFNTPNFSGTKKREAKSEAYSASPFKYSFIASPCNECCGHTVQQLGTVYMGVFDGIEEEKLPYVLEFLQFLIDEEGSAILSSVKNMPTANVKVGNANFPDLEKGNIVYIGNKKDSDTMLRLNQLMRTLTYQYERDIDPLDLLKNSIELVKQD